MKWFVWSGLDRSKSVQELTAHYRDLRSKGIDGVFLGGGIDDREFEIVRESGLELHSWMWTTNRNEKELREEHPDWFMVSRSGKSCVDQPPYVDYYRWLSPVVPGVQTYLQERADELASNPFIQGVHLDYVRYPDVILPRGLWAQYGLDQTEELADYDFCYSSHTCEAFEAEFDSNPINIEFPHLDQEWLHFRYDSITKLVVKLRQQVDRHNKSLTAAVFPTPRLARMICRQDWDKWPLDAVCPMIYHSFYEEDLKWVGDCVREDVHAVRFPIFAGLFMPAFNTVEEFKQGLQLVQDNGGAGVSLFGGIAPEYWQGLEEFRS